MKNHWITFIKGMILVKLSGRGVERFLNQLSRSNIVIWNIKRVSSTTVTFYISLHHLHKLRKHVRQYDVDISLLHGKGIPFLWKRAKKNSGFLLGLFLFILLIITLSNIIWEIEIDGASPEVEYKIRKELDKIGIQTGKLKFLLHDVETIQSELTNRIHHLTWVGIDIKGTTFHFQVVEKNAPKREQQAGPQNLVASKKAVIVDMFVENGQPKVSINDFVKPGQLLVSGLIGKDDSQRYVTSRGKVWGKTWYKTKVEIPLTSQFQVFTGKEKNSYHLQIGQVTLPLWGLGEHDFKQYKTEEKKHPIHFLKWTLPVRYIKKTIREEEKVVRRYNKKEAVEKGIKLAKKDVKVTIPEDAKIAGEKVLREKVENGKVKLIISYQVIENIAMEQPLIKETEE